MSSINFCDLTPDERTTLLQEERAWKADAHDLLKKAYPEIYCRSFINWSPEKQKIAAHWLSGTRVFWVRCGGAEMRCQMHEFPLFTIEEYLNSDTYGRKPIGTTMRPEKANEFAPYEGVP